jgi:excinuclease ABC subunit A
LRDLGNTVIVVEHDEDAIKEADYIVDIGPGAGVHGGEIIAQGSLEDIMNSERSLTGKYLSGKEFIVIPEKRNSTKDRKWVKLIGATGNNLQSVTLVNQP